MDDDVFDLELRVRSLGQKEAMLVLSLVEMGRSSFSLADASALVGDPQSARSAIQRLRQKGWIRPLARGRYFVYPPSNGAFAVENASAADVASHFVEGRYVGWQSAAALHGLSWQRSGRIYVGAPRRVRARRVDNVDINFVLLPERKMFDIEKHASTGAMVSSIAKTVVDCFDRLDLSGGWAEASIILARSLLKTSVGDICSAVVRNGSQSCIQRVGFVLSQTCPDLLNADLREMLKRHVGPGLRSKFGRNEACEHDFGYVPEWQLQVNIGKTEFVNEVGRFY